MHPSQRELKSAQTIHVVGGGCFGSQYVRWLLRARERGMARLAKIVAVDRDPACRLAREGPRDAGLEIVTKDWIEYLAGFLTKHHDAPESVADDHWVPSPLSPHLLFMSFLRAARDLGVIQDFQEEEFREAVPPPVQVPLANGDLAVSFAEWQCPVNCIEPATCPAIHAPRTWDMKTTLENSFRAQEGSRSSHVLQCRHWVHGVGTIPMMEIFEEFGIMLEGFKVSKTREVVVATTSGCHGLISRGRVAYGPRT